MTATEKIRALTAAANAATGAGDTDLTGAVRTLIDGYGQGGGLSWADVLYDGDLNITYTSTSAGTAATISGLTGIAKYPFVVVEIVNANDAKANLKFLRSCTELSNLNFAAGTVSIGRYGSQHYYSSSGTLTQASSTTYGLFGYTYTAAGNLTIRGRCNSSYYNSLTGTYHVRVLGLKN